jgi:23S rRNA (uracil1939-C5)-methyltransferase
LPKSAKTVADLFSGAGTLALPMARRASVSAYDSDKRAIAALANAVRHAQGLKPVTAQVRDLFRDPLSARELSHFDAVVLDPPRAGAAAQAERLAASKVPVVIAVSCSAATLARDARTLVDGGYRMGPVTPIDQFLYSAHVEAVAVFRR